VKWVVVKELNDSSLQKRIVWFHKLRKSHFDAKTSTSYLRINQISQTGTIGLEFPYLVHIFATLSFLINVCQELKIGKKIYKNN